MKQLHRVFVLFLVFALVLMPLMVQAKSSNGKGNGSTPAPTEVTNSINNSTSNNNSNNDVPEKQYGYIKKQVNEFNEYAAKIQTRLTELNENPEENADLIARMEQAGNTIQEKLQYLNQQQTKTRNEWKVTVRNMYTDEEINQLNQVATQLQAQGLKALPAYNVCAVGKNLKFDTPPVIKDGRTLVPVRALTTAYGFIVDYDSETKTISLVRDDLEISFTIDGITATVNGESFELDVPASSFSGRTVLPLRFFIDQLGFNITWNSDDQTVIIDDEDSDDEDSDDTITDNDQATDDEDNDEDTDNSDEDTNTDDDTSSDDESDEDEELLDEITQLPNEDDINDDLTEIANSDETTSGQ